ncbi:hypothetical protein BDZ89DRAFT_440406 [Hymenopellis radicata]|nr:hypothetical protein BDZ89DRAFT_440406 [Hymenopellis radicata]
MLGTKIFSGRTPCLHTRALLDGAVPRKGSTAVGVYGNLMTFGSGVRACIGWRFALLEFQTILLYLIKDFEFDVDPTLSSKLRRDASLIMLPMLEGEDDKGPQMPLYVSLVKRDGDE